MNNKKRKVVLVALVALAIVGLVVVCGDPVKPTDGVQTFISLLK